MGAFLTGFCLSAAPALAQPGSVAGTVTSSGAAVSGVQVRLDGTTLSTFSDGIGRYTVSNVPPGTYVVRATRVGYQVATTTINVQSGQTTNLNIVLAAIVPVSRFISPQDLTPPLPPDSVRLPVPAVAIVRQRQATRIAISPQPGETFELPLFRDVVLRVLTESVRPDARGTHIIGRIVGSAAGFGNVVAVVTPRGVNANVRDGTTLFLIRPQFRGVQLVVEVDQSKMPDDHGEDAR